MNQTSTPEELSRDQILLIRDCCNGDLLSGKKQSMFRTDHLLELCNKALLSERTLNAAPQAGGEQSSSSAPEVTQSPAVAALREVIEAWDEHLQDEAEFSVDPSKLDKANAAFERLRLAVKAAEELLK